MGIGSLEGILVVMIILFSWSWVNWFCSMSPLVVSRLFCMDSNGSVGINISKGTTAFLVLNGSQCTPILYRCFQLFLLTKPLLRLKVGQSFDGYS